MKSIELVNLFKKQFDVVGIIKTSTYLALAKKYSLDVPTPKYQTMAVVALAYPKRILHHDHEYLIPSFYTYGNDYHLVLKNRMLKAVANLKCNVEFAVDNHPHNERLAALAAGIGFFGKNQLIINKDYGSFIFLGLVFLDTEIDAEQIPLVDDDCGSCTICLQACPTKAITSEGFNQDACISHYNQSKKELTDLEIKSNYLLFGCDICQVVCPKNKNKGKLIHPEFELNGKEKVSIHDLFTLSNQQFLNQYAGMAYLWKGKTILMRNALIVMMKYKIKDYNDLILSSITKQHPNWYNKIALKAIEVLSK
jgi:epoxyqueuosine reductase